MVKFSTPNGNSQKSWKIFAVLPLLLAFVFFNQVKAQTYCSSGFTYSACAYGLNDFWITNVSFGTLNFTGGTCNGGSYGSGSATYSLQSATGAVTQGSTYTLSVSRAGTSYKTLMYVYADWNHNGVFTDAGENIMALTKNAGVTGAYTQSVTVPAGALTGTTRIRVVSKYNTAPTSCNTSGQGETKDFNITVLASCTAPTTQATTFATNSVTTSSCNVTFTRGNGTGGVLVVAHDNSAVASLPTSGTSYTANSTFGLGSTTGTGDYVVYNSNSPASGTVTVPVTGLTNGHTYYFAIYEYNSASTCYNTTALTGSVLIITGCTGTPTAGTATPTTSALCPGSTTTLNLAGYTTGVSGIVFQWQQSATGAGGSFTNVSGGSGATSASYTTAAQTNGTGSNLPVYYQCIVTCQNGGASANSNTTSITVYPTPSITINGSNTYSASMCSSGSPNSVSLTASNASTGTTTYSWAGTGVSPTTGASVTATPATTTTFTVTGTANTCTATATAAITVNPSTLTFTPANPSVALGGGVSITASATSSNGSVSYNWSPASTLSSSTGATVSASPLSSTTYTVTASDGAGCSRTGTVTVNVTSGTPGLVSCGYSFSTSTGYTAVSGGTALGAAGSTNYSIDLSAIATPFTFDFNGITYSKFGVNGNGFIWFGNTAPAATTTSPISSSAGMDGVVAAWGFALSGGSVQWLLSGTSPNRTLKIQWGGTTTANATCLDAQVILNEHGGTNSDKIQISIKSESSCLTNQASSPQIGLRGASNSDFNNRTQASGLVTSTSTSAGTLNTSAVSLNAATYVNANILWTYSPVVATPTITPAGTQNICVGGSGVTLTANTSVTSPTYQWINFASGTPIGGATSSTYLANPSPAGNYYYAVKVTNGSGCSRTSAATPVVAASCGPNLYTVTGGNNCTSTTVGLSGSDATATYQLLLNGSNLGSPISGTGSSISFGAQTAVGTYTVVATLGSTLTMTGSAVVYGLPSVSYSGLAASYCINGAAVTLSGSPSGGTFSGTGVSGSTFTPATAGAGGPYNVVYSYTDAHSCTNTATNSTTVHALPSVSFSGLNANYCTDASAVTLSGSPSGGSFSGTGVSGSTFTPASAGAGGPYSITYSYTDGFGCSNTSSNNTTVHALPTVSFSGLASSYVVTDPAATLTGSPSGGTFSGTGVSGNTFNPATAGVGGPYTITYTYTDGFGCTASSNNNTDVTGPSITYTWNGSVNSAWTNGNNWSPAITGGPNSCSHDVIIPAVTNQPTISSAVSVGNLQLNAGAQLTANADISVCKNITGAFTVGITNVTGTGKIVLNGSTAQTINGVITVNELKLNNSHGASLISSAQLTINNALDLQSGNFNASVGIITFASSSVTQAAILDNFSSGYTGTFTGTVRAQRFYLASQSYNQHFMGTPVNNTGFSQFGASGTTGYIIPTANCDETRIAGNSPYSTVLALDETHGSTCTSAQWIAEASSSGNMVNGKGYAVAKAGSGTFTVSGTPNLNNSYSLSGLTNSNWSNTTLQGHTVTSGWHLIANPYLASWAPGSLTAAGFDNQVQVWNANGPFAGSYQPYIAGVNAVIPPFGAVMVHKTTAGGTATFTINASDRVRTAATFYQANNNELTIVAKNNNSGLLDQTVVAFNTDATDQFDASYDAAKSPGALDRHTIYSVNNNQWMSRNILHDIAQTSTVAVGFEPGNTSTYTFSFNGVNTFDATSYIYLEDKALGLMHNVRNGDYTFTADSADNWNRFVLHFTPAAVFSTTDAGCNTNGKIHVEQPGDANWNYTITDASNTVISTGVVNQNNPINLSATAGNYMLTLVDNNNYTVNQALSVGGAQPIAASFNASATAVHTNQAIQLTSTTTNASGYDWNFGNGQVATGQSVSYEYPIPGTYTVVLTVTNLSGCTSTASRSLTVADVATGLNNIVDSKAIGIWSNENTIYVDFRTAQKVDAVISIYNVLGQEISSEKFTNSTIYKKEISNVEAAYMIVNVKMDDKVTTKKVLINNMK